MFGIAIIYRFWARVKHAQARHRSRKVLLGLDAAMLKDIGISRADALQEGSKPFWRQ